MDKGTHFIGQPAFGQLISLLDKSKILKISREVGGERYVKKFDAWQHMVIMLYAIIKRFDSSREISDSMFPEARKLAHIGVRVMPRRSTLSDANARRPGKVFEAAYKDLYSSFHDELSSDSRKRQNPKWMDKLKIMDSTTISLFSNLIFKGVGRNEERRRHRSQRKNYNLCGYEKEGAQARVSAHQRHEHGAWRNRRNLQKKMDDRVPVQTVKTKFSTQVLLRRGRKRHQNTDLDNPHSKHAPHDNAKTDKTQLEFLWSCYHDKNHANVLYEHLHIP